jgi:rRNA processing protein Gar1
MCGDFFSISSKRSSARNHKVNKVLLFVYIGLSTPGGDFLIKLGKLLHISSSGNLIVRADAAAPLGAIVFTERAKRVGQVGDVFGPKKAPYISVKSPFDRKSLTDLLGKTLFYAQGRASIARSEDRRPRSYETKKGGGYHE